MYKNIFILVLISYKAFSQVGVNTTAPNAQLDIRSSNQATPANTDGVLIPKVDAFPVTNPTAAQQGMLVYLTTLVGPNQPGFYYWNNLTTTWVGLAGGGGSGGTLDQAYDYGGAGVGKTITADAGAVLIDGTDGLLSTGTTGSGTLATSGAGTRMLWNPRKAAFRAGRVFGSQWDDSNIGVSSVAFGLDTTAKGVFSTAFGAGTLANEYYSTAFGYATTANAFGSTSFGRNTTAYGDYSTAIGSYNNAFSYGETVLGIGATDYTASTDGTFLFGSAEATDRLLVVGNAIDANGDNLVDNVERSDALIILKNGLTRLPSTTTAMITSADGKAVVTKEYLATLPVSGGWSLIGNAGTVSGTNFIGTTDNVNVSFRRNNTKSGFLGATNTSFGFNSHSGTTTGGDNAIFGANAGRIIGTGSSNVAIGSNAMYSTGSGTNNNAIGHNALYTNTSGGNNTSIGYFSMYNNLAGSNNVAIGSSALFANTGSQNVAIGDFALNAITSGTNNIGIGYQANVANPSGTNQIRLGNTSITSAETQVAWTITSDKRWKNTINDSNLGLEFISKLRPVSYFRNNDETKKVEYGLIAQELQKTLHDFNVTNSGIISQSNDSMLGVRYNDLIPILIKSIQEQQAIIEVIEKELKELKQNKK